jgi:anhydro-N-acetylmuramic acid kinase
LVQELLAHPFLARTPPKSTGREAFGAPFIADLSARARRMGIAGDDLVATVTAFIAATMIDAYRRFILPQHPRLDSVLCGGGRHNPALVDHLHRELPQIVWRPSEAFGISPDALEAVIFAVLAHETMCGHPANVPTATGAERAVLLGKVVPGRHGWGRLPWQG